MKDIKPRVVVLGIGNLLRRDDGAGIHAIQELQKAEPPPGICFIDGGTSPDLLSLIEPDTQKLVIVDALRGGGEPGSIYRYEINESHISDEPAESLHGLGVLEALKMMQMLGRQPHSIMLIGVEPVDTGYGLGLSPVIQSALPRLLEVVRRELNPPY